MGGILIALTAIIMIFGIPLSVIITKSSIGQAIAENIRKRGGVTQENQGSMLLLEKKVQMLEDQILELSATLRQLDDKQKFLTKLLEDKRS